MVINEQDFVQILYFALETKMFTLDNFPTKVRLMNKCHAYSVEAEASTTYTHQCIS